MLGVLMASAALVLVIAAQVWALAFDAVHTGGWNQSLVDTFMVTMLVLIAIGVLLALPLGLGWRTSLLLAVACESLVLAGAVQVEPFSSPISRLARGATGPGSASAYADRLIIMYLPLLLVLGWAVVQSARARRIRNRGDLAV